MDDPRVLRFSSWRIDYPFAERLYPGALDVVAGWARKGTAVVLSDGDAVFQPLKVERSGLREGSATTTSSTSTRSASSRTSNASSRPDST